MTGLGRPRSGRPSLERHPVAATGVPQRNGLVAVPAVSVQAPLLTCPKPMQGAIAVCMSGKVTGCMRPSPLKPFNVLAAAAMFSRVGDWLPTLSIAPPKSSIVAQPTRAELFCMLSGAYLFMASIYAFTPGIDGLSHVAVKTSEVRPSMELPNCLG